MGPFRHLAYSAAAAGALYIHFRNLKMPVACMAAGVLVDMDHLIEYASYCKGKWDWNEFASGSYFNTKGTVKVIFHSWEAAIILWSMILLNDRLRKSGELRGIAVGYTLHLFLDQIGNNLNHLGYFVGYRRMVEWQQEKLIRK